MYSVATWRLYISQFGIQNTWIQAEYNLAYGKYYNASVTIGVRNGGRAVVDVRQTVAVTVGLTRHSGITKALILFTLPCSRLEVPSA